MTPTATRYESLTGLATALMQEPHPPVLQSLYRDASGTDEILICRYERNGKKIIVPYHLDSAGIPVKKQAKSEGRCLFRSDRIAASPAAPVLVCEGEKCAQSPQARGLMDAGWIVTCWQGGSAATLKTDWSLLQGRDVTIWPDSDEVGLAAAREIKKLVPQARVLVPPEELPKGGDLADIAWSSSEIQSWIETASELVPEEKQPQEPPLEVKFFLAEATHGLGADVLAKTHRDIVFDRSSGDFFQKPLGAVAHERVIAPLDLFRRTLEDAIRETLDALLSGGGATATEAKKYYETTGRSLKKIQSRDFLRGTSALFAELSAPKTKDGCVPWNATHEAHALLDAVLDLSGESPITRRPLDDEYFQDPLQISAYDFAAADPLRCPHFDRFMSEVHPDAATRETAEFCAAAILGNRGARLIVEHVGLTSAGKDTESDLKRELLPGKVGTFAKDMVILSGDSGVKRFSAGRGRGKLAMIVSEIGEKDHLDEALLKDLSNGARLVGEQKGRDPFEYDQTAVLILHTNHPPIFNPDAALLNRMVFIPHTAFFYRDEDDKKTGISLGIDPGSMFPQRDKEEFFPPILKERAAIIKRWALMYIRLRDQHNRRVPESPACRVAKERYRLANDLLEQFFLEYLQRDDGGPGLSNREIESSWDEFSSKPWKRGGLKTALQERFDFVQPRRLQIGWWIFGVKKREAEADETPF